MSEKEKLYDDEIAPALLALGKQCEQHGFSLVAVVEWEPGETARTVTLQAGASFKLKLVELAARCCGNVDAMFMGLMKYAKEHGHSSIFLKRLGVDETPK